MAKLSLLRIPHEMQNLRQWAVASLTPRSDGKLDKAPRNPHTGTLVSSTDPSTWVTFEEAINSGYPGVGFMLAPSDPYTIIDLDYVPDAPEELVARQRKIYEAFDTYAERSQSGKGLHIIVRGKISGGSRRDGVEVYDQERFMICTGDVVRDAPISAHQSLLEIMVEEMGGTRSEADLAESRPERLTDDEIMSKLLNARNSDKFKDLYYRAPGPQDDWSWRDASLAQMIALHTRNHEQALRIFRGSALYRPNAKGKNPAHYEQYYLLERTFGRAWRAEDIRAADVDTGRKMAEKVLASMHQPEVKEQPAPKSTITFPPGLVGEIATFILHSSQRPVPEIALAGAITFCSGLLGRQYNISNTGLNLYTVLVAQTGRGKESAAAGVDMLMTALRQTMPAVDEYRGPGHIASGQALVKHLSTHPACFAFLSEFGHVLKIITNPRANAADLRTKQVLLDLFAKSGQRQMLHSSIYSDQEKNTKMVQGPCFAFMGDTTPEGYYDSVSEGLINEGLIPRFLTISYEGPRVPRNRTPIVSPSPELTDRLTTLFTSIANMFYSNTFVDIGATEEAQAELDLFDEECDRRINAQSGLAEMWNRAHLKVLRLAGLVAVGKNHFEPVVDIQDVRWAVGIVVDEIQRLEKRFHEGRVGEGETRHEGIIADAVRDYLKLSPQSKASTYKVPASILDRHDLIPYTFFRRRLKQNKAFTEDRRGLIPAIKAALADACETGVLQELTEDQKAEIAVQTQSKRLNASVYCIGEDFS